MKLRPVRLRAEPLPPEPLRLEKLPPETLRLEKLPPETLTLQRPRSEQLQQVEVRPAERRREARSPQELEPAPSRAGVPVDQSGATPVQPAASRMPLYPRLLRLRHVHPNGWQRAVLGEGMAAVGALLALADVATAWSVLVLPVAVAAVVKSHDLLAGLLLRDQPEVAESS